MTNSERVAALYKRHHAWCMQVAFNLTNNHDSAEDLVQDMYAKLLEMKDLHKIIYDNTDLNLFYIYKIFIRSRYTIY
jgi:hypothetical protein